MTDDSPHDEFSELVDHLNSTRAETVVKGLKRIASMSSRQPESAGRLDVILPSLVKHLDHQDPTVCSACCWAVGHVGRCRLEWAATVIPRLVQLTQHANAKVREMAVWAMGSIGRAEPPIVAPHLRTILERTKDSEGRVRLSAIWACENIATQRPEWFADHLELFIDMLDDPDTKHVRGEVPELFRVIGKRRPDLVESAIPELRRKLDDGDRVTRIHAAGALRAIEKAKGSSK